MNTRTIDGIFYNLRFIVAPGSPPPCAVTFTDPDGEGRGEGRVVFVDAEAEAMWTATDRIAMANTLLDARAAALPDLPTIAARMTAVDDLDREARAKKATADALDEQIATKTAALAAADEQLAVRATALAAEAPVAVAEKAVA